MPNLKCPRCAHVVFVPEGVRPSCSRCGHGQARGAAQPNPPGDPFASFSRPGNRIGAPRGPPVPRLRQRSAPRSRCPSSVTTGTTIAIVGAGAMALAGILLLAVGPHVAKALSTQELRDAGAALFVALGAFKLVFAAALGVAAGFTFLGHNWARVMLVVLLSLDAASCLYGAVAGPSVVAGAWVVADIVAVVALFAGASAEYFRERGRRARGPAYW